ncbi:unnamed protein product [Symbiodinium sp. CCMP2592]|nr:unnamed protein product [Symbiodinium sp. CCMP2592]
MVPSSVSIRFQHHFQMIVATLSPRGDLDRSDRSCVRRVITLVITLLPACGWVASVITLLPACGWVASVSCTGESPRLRLPGIPLALFFFAANTNKASRENGCCAKSLEDAEDIMRRGRDRGWAELGRDKGGTWRDVGGTWRDMGGTWRDMGGTWRDIGGTWAGHGRDMGGTWRDTGGTWAGHGRDMAGHGRDTGHGGTWRDTGGTWRDTGGTWRDMGGTWRDMGGTPKTAPDTLGC